MIPGFPTITVEKFSGQFDAANLRDVPREYSPDCPNCAFDPGSVFTRPGTVQKIDWGADVTNVLKATMIHSIGGLRYYLALLVTAAGTEFAYFRETNPSRTTLIAAATLDQASTNFRFAIYGNLVLIVFSNGVVGNAAPYVWNPTTDDVDSATHAAPDTSAVAAAQGAAGVVTAGLHKIIILWRTRTGYETRPGSTVVEFTAVDGFSIDLTALPVGGADATITDIIIGMTPADDGRYFQVTAQADEEDSTYTINVSDETLLNQRSLDGHFNFMHPLKNFLGIQEYNNRMVWIAPSDEPSLAWISQAGLPVCVREDTGYIPFGREDGDRLTTGFQIRKAIYLTKTRAVWVTQDTGGDPATWAKPYQVCKWAGTVAPWGVSQSSDKDEAFLLDIKGIYRFMGGDPVMVSQNIGGTFDRLNYAQTPKLTMAVDPLESRVFAWVPLDSDANPTTLIVGDYKEGWSKAKWSPWTTDGTAWRDVFADSAEVLIQEAGRYLCRFDDHSNTQGEATNSTNERDGTAIDSYYEPGVLQKNPAGLHLMAGVTVYGSGAGVLDLSFYDQDGTLLTKPLTGSINPTASTAVVGVGTLFTTELVVGNRIIVNGETRTVTVITDATNLTVDTAFTDTGNDTSPQKLPTGFTLSTTSGRDYFRGVNYHEERFFHRFGTNAANERFRVSRLTFYLKPDGFRAN